MPRVARRASDSSVGSETSRRPHPPAHRPVIVATGALSSRMAASFARVAREPVHTIPAMMTPAATWWPPESATSPADRASRAQSVKR